MKGIAHFMTGVAIATCFPEVVALGREGALLPVLGGVGGLLPDVLDFRFVRFFEKYDVEIDPAPALSQSADLASADSAPAPAHSVCGTPLDPTGVATDAKAVPETPAAVPPAVAAATVVADALAAAMREAHTTGTPRSVIAHTLPLGTNLWRRYTIRFDPDRGTVAVCMGPVVTTSQVAYPGTELPGADWVERQVGVTLVHTYSSLYHVDAFSGPSFRFVRERTGADGDVLTLHFLDWHHRWTHSLPLALALGVAVGGVTALVAALTGAGPAVGMVPTASPVFDGVLGALAEIVPPDALALGLKAGGLTWLGASAHILEDQLGHMGSNLWWPFTRHRIPGLRLLHANEAIPNFLVVWTALALILLNLDRLGGPGRLPLIPYLVLAFGLPWVSLGTLHLARHRRTESQPASPATGSLSAASLSASSAERLAEAQGFDID